MGPINAAGTGSGIDVNGLVADLVAAEGDHKTKQLDAKEASALAKITAFGTLKGALADFETSLSSLDELSDFQVRSVDIEDSTKYTASAKSSAQVGEYDIEVVQLASANKVRTNDFAALTTQVGTGTLTIQVGAKIGSINVVSGSDTVEKIRDSINANSNILHVRATTMTVDTGTRLVLTGLDGGALNNITVSVTDDGDENNTDNAGLSQLISANLTTIDAAKDAIIKIDNATITKDTNNFDDVIEGVSLTALQTTDTGVTKKLTVSLDKGTTISRVTQFVDSYNAVFDTIKDLTKYISTDADNGVLLGDSTLRSLEFGIRSKINDKISSATGSYNVLAQIGITTDYHSGKIKLDTSKLISALDNDYDSVGSLFASSDGVAKNLQTYIHSYTQTSGLIDNRTKGLNSEIDDIAKQRANLEKYLDSLEERLYSQFINMDIIVQQLQQTSEYLTDALAKLPDPAMHKRR